MMAKIERFEDIQGWQKGRILVRGIYGVTEQTGFARDFGLKDQIRRSAVSVVSNIAEGFARRTNREFIQFLYISHGSVAEVEAQLYVALDLGYIAEPKFKELYDLCYEISKLIMGFIKYLSSLEGNAAPTQ